MCNTCCSFTAASTPSRGQREGRTTTREANRSTGRTRGTGDKEASGAGRDRRRHWTTGGEGPYIESDPEPEPAPKKGKYMLD